MEEVLIPETEEIEAPRPVKIQVGRDHGVIYLALSEPIKLIGFRPEQALDVARQLRNRANQVLHDEYLADARARREKKEKRRA